MEGLPSINTNGGTTMLDEINASTQPGWTTGTNNDLYDKGGNVSTVTAPGGIGQLDPSAPNLPPVADANGPYTGEINMPVSFDGSGSSDPTGLSQPTIGTSVMVTLAAASARITLTRWTVYTA